MDIDLEPGKYVVAVSGGVDSVVLLDLLSKKADMELVVAHFDHGIRAESPEDCRFVQTLAKDYSLLFEYAEGRLGSDASEAKARETRYNFLNKILKKHQARAIVTAHHEDDALETAVINLLRGTGRKGLSALASSSTIKRPLLQISKQDIIKYARDHSLKWREDTTNQEEVYLRNYIRRQLLPRFSEQDKHQLLNIIDSAKINNKELDNLLYNELRQYSENGNLNKSWFKELPHGIALEVMAAWLREQNIRDFDSRTLDRLVVAAKMARPGQKFDVLKGVTMRVGKTNLALQAPER